LGSDSAEQADDQAGPLAAPGPAPGNMVAFFQLAAEPRSPAWARRHAQAVLAAWGLPDDTIQTAILLVSELVTNACNATTLHGPAVTITQTLRRLPGRVVIEVSDPDPRPPILTDAGPDAESGRGLHLVDALSKEWSYYFPPSGGKTVYCTLTHHEPEANQ
jgi:anti-sigma regulatory factor (Ser/Thr protein kinase)